jgi:AraC-like DNA-binding protein
MHRHPVYESWGPDSTAALPQRTHLYHLRPLQTGSMFVESLTGYIARLAEAHDVSVAMLLNRELLPRMASTSGDQKIPKNATFLYQSHVMNGAGDYAQNCVRVLESLTGAGNLHAMTLLRLSGVLSVQNCLRTRRAWCSRCFEHWRSMGMPIYEPLLWAIEPVSCCPAHGCKLSVRCPHCNQTLYTLSARSRPGYCCRCQQWLGERSAPDAPADPAFAQNVGVLLATRGESGPFSKTLFKTNLRCCIDNMTDGNVNRFCIAIGMSYESGVHWLRENGRIRLELLIRVCSQLGLSPLRFLTEFLADDDFEHGRELIDRNTSHMKKMRAQARLNAQLETALRAEPPVSLHEVAAQLGYSSAISLRRRNPEICDRISNRYRQATVRTLNPPLKVVPANATIRRALCKALAQRPRIPLKTVACNLGFRNVVSLYNRFPELCRAFAVANAKEKAERLAPMRIEIEAALSETPPPTVRELAIRLGCSDAVLKYRFPELRAALLKRMPARKQFVDGQVLDLMQRVSLEEPPPSIGEVARRSGKSVGYLRALRPGLFHAIKARHFARRKLEASNRRAAYRAEINSAITELRQCGIKPSRKRVIAAIPQPSMRSCHIIDHQIAESLREVEASPGNLTGGRH